MASSKTTSDLSRRQFFKRLVGRTQEAIETVQRPSDDIDEAQMRRLAPNLFSSQLYAVQDNTLMLRNPTDGHLTPLSELDAQDRFIMRQFDGTHSLGDIMDHLVKIYELAPSAASHKVKRMFFLFRDNKLCDTLVV